MSVPVLLAGALLLGLAAYDAAVTTISTTSAGGPITSRLGRWTWRAAHRVARRPASLVLSGAGPLVLVVTIATWLLLLWAGWTLVFSADPSAVVQSTSRQPGGWADRAYFAGFTTFTLGVGDYVPVGAPWQLLTIVATVSGLGLTTVAITYLVPVVTAVTQRSQQAASIAGLGRDAHAIVETVHHGGSVRFLEPFLLRVTDSLLLTAERHLSYPILHYFHPRSPGTELRVQLAALADAVTLVEHGLADEVDRPHPASIVAFRTATDHFLDRAHVTASATAPPLGLGPLRAAGLPVVDDDVFAQRVAAAGEQRDRLAAYAAESKWPRGTTTS